MHNTAWHDKPLYSSCRKSCMTPSSMTNLCWCVNGDQAVFLWCGDTLYVYVVCICEGPRLVGCLPRSLYVWSGYGKAHRLGWALCQVWCGGVLLSHTLSGAVPLPCQVLASGFGMGPGVSPGPWPPQVFNYQPVWVGCVVVWGPVGGRDACVCS